MYLYPNNLRAKAVLWLWELKDIGVIGISFVISIFIYSKIGLIQPTVIVFTYAILTIKVEDISILDFLKYACVFFLRSNQSYEWSVERGKNEEE